jgi:PKD repeat protein
LSKTSRRLIVALAACLIAFSASTAVAAPTAGFTVSANPRSGMPVTFTSTSAPAAGSAITSQVWNINGIAYTGDTATHTFAASGSYTVTLTVTSDEAMDNQAVASQTVAVATRVPTAEFSFGPPNPDAGVTTVFFSNASTDPDGDPLGFTWDFGDGSGPSTARNPSHVYADPGTKTVRLTVNDGRGGVDDVTHTVVVRDPSAASASFSVSPANPLVGQRVTFGSTATPSANQTIESLAWDLDSDGQYDDGDTASASRTFSDPGVYRVALRVVQSNDEVSIAEGTVRVSALPQFPGQPPVIEPPSQDPPRIGRLSLLSPFPVVRLVGQAYARRTVVSLLAVRAPRGSLVRVRCKGKGGACPKAARRKRSQGRKTLRFKAFEGSIRAGAKLEIFVVRSGRIGKFTRFKLRSSKIPLRTDACVVPGKRKPRPCPS